MVVLCLAAFWFLGGRADSPEMDDFRDTAKDTAKQGYEKVREKLDEMKETEESGEDPPEDSDIELIYVDGYNYRLNYKGEEFDVLYWYDNWQIIDSWKITSQKDITRICELLIEEHPIHGSDMESYRTAEDMAYEWQQHNIAYQMLPDGNAWKEHARSVDLDPADQGRTIQEIYEDRTGKKLDLEDLLN